MGFGDFGTAAKARDVLLSMMEGVVNQMRPEPRIGKCTAVDSGSYTAQVMFPGSSDSISVKFSPSLGPRLGNEMVRVAGRPGNYYVIDILSNGGVNESYEWSIAQPGDIMMTGRDTASDGWLLCQGQFVNQADYPNLFAAIAHKFNGGIDPGDGTFKLPNFAGRQPVGASATFPLGTRGGQGLPAQHTHVAGTLATAAHTLNFRYSANTYTTGGTQDRITSIEGQPGAQGSALSATFSHNITGSTGNNTAPSDNDSMDPYQAINFVIKT